MELKPCPFCGGEIELLSVSVNGQKQSVSGTFQCLGCSAKFTIKSKFEHEPPSKALEKAINRRIGDDLMERMEDDRK